MASIKRNRIARPELSVRIWVTPKGEEKIIPAEFLNIKFNKNGYPNKRDKKYNEFMAWCES